MAKKQQHVPGTRSSKPNRATRRGSEPTGDTPRPRDESRPPAQDVESVRAKSSGHGKKTADNWNQ